MEPQEGGERSCQPDFPDKRGFVVSHHGYEPQGDPEMGDGSKGPQAHEDKGHPDPVNRRGKQNRDEREPCCDPGEGDKEYKRDVCMISRQVQLALVFNESEVSGPGKGHFERGDHHSFSFFIWKPPLFC
jgi:hypothetical protein